MSHRYGKFGFAQRIYPEIYIILSYRFKYYILTIPTLGMDPAFKSYIYPASTTQLEKKIML